MPDQPIKHGHQHRFKGPDAILTGQYEIKVFPDKAMAELSQTDLPVFAGSGLFIFSIPEDLHHARLRRAEAFVTTVGTSPTIVQIRNITQGVNLLGTPITIDASEFSSRTAVESVPITTLAAECDWGDLIGINVNSAGAGAWGLGVILEFGV